MVQINTLAKVMGVYCDLSANVEFAARGPDPSPPYHLYQTNELAARRGKFG